MYVYVYYVLCTMCNDTTWLHTDGHCSRQTTGTTDALYLQGVVKCLHGNNIILNIGTIVIYYNIITYEVFDCFVVLRTKYKILPVYHTLVDDAGPSCKDEYTYN